MNCCGKKKIEDLLASNAKLAELLHKKSQKVEPEPEPKKNRALYVFAIIGSIAVIALVAYFVYRKLNPVYVEEGEFEDDFEDMSEEDFEDENDAE